MEKWFWGGLAVFGGLLLAASLAPSSRPRHRIRFYSDALLGVSMLVIGAANLFPLSRPARLAVNGLGVLAALGALVFAMATVLSDDRAWRKEK